MKGDRGDHELAHQIRVLDGDLQGDAGSQAIAEEVGILDADLLQERGRVVRHLLDGQRTIDIGRAAVRLLFDGDDLPGLRTLASLFLSFGCSFVLFVMMISLYCLWVVSTGT